MKKNLFYIISVLLVVSACKGDLEKEKLKARLIEDSLKHVYELEIKNAQLAIEKEIQTLLADSIKKLAANTYELSLAALYKKIKPSVFLLLARDADENINQGTAFTINDMGLAISNYHVFDNASQAIAVNENEEEFMITEILEFDSLSDYIIFRLGPNKSFKHLSISNSLPEVGEDCFAVGNPRGLVHTLSTGVISAYRDRNRIIQTDASFTLGSSGGPLFNSRGEVIGITTSVLKGDNINFAVSLKSIPAIDKWLAYDKQNTDEVDYTFLLNVIYEYFDIVSNEQFSRLEYLFADTLYRYYHYFNKSISFAINDIRTYKERFDIIDVSFEVDYNKLSIIQQGDKFIISVPVIYHLDRASKSLPNRYSIRLYFQINTDLKIQSIYEDILDRKRI